MADPSAEYQITFDCADPDTMAHFWAAALHYELQEPPEPFDTWKAYWLSVGVPAEELGDGDGYDSIIDPGTHRPRIWFQQVPDSKHVKNRLHFDLMVGGGRSVPLDERRRRVRAEAQRLMGAGAAMVREFDSPESDHFFVAMTDPEGNEFDVV